jgi:UDP-apiose/xylose synthase
MKLLLLGAGGFLGSHIVEHMIERGDHDIVGADISDAKLAGIEGPNFEFMKANLMGNTEVVEELIENADVVVDLISMPNPSLYVSDPLKIFNVTFRRNLEVVDLCVKHQKRLIQYSTSEIYGRPQANTYQEDITPLVMGPVTNQRWIYAVSKQMLERVIHAYSLRDELDYSIIRPFNAIGPRLDYLVEGGAMGGPRVVAHFVSALLENGPMYLVDGGLQRRSFTAVQDASSAFAAILDSPDAHNQIYHYGNPGNDTSIKGLAEIMIEIYEEITGTASGAHLEVVDAEKFYGKGYEDTTRVPPDISKLKSIGWEPKISLRQTLTETLSYYMHQRGLL